MPKTVMTKKEQILALARQDPFLKVEEIALQVETTPPYVRTTLSEADVSLMQLRREYARQMEKRLSGKGSGNKHEIEPHETKSAVPPTQQCIDKLRVRKIRNTAWAHLLNADGNEHLLMISRIRVQEGLRVLSQLVTTDDISLSEDSLLENPPLWKLLAHGSGHIKLQKGRIEVEKSDPTTALYLNIPPGDPVLRSSGVVAADGVSIGLEFNIFAAYAVRIHLNGEDEYKMAVEEKTG
ncbi:MAG: hypothetical protein GX316_07165 [Firmicutes bacterium]|nr:hypothetical protein [Bacillota bacterium]